MLNLDTHILLYALADDLTPRESSLLSRDSWSISAIVLWEIAKLSELGRIEIDLDSPELARTLAMDCQHHAKPALLDDHDRRLTSD